MSLDEDPTPYRFRFIFAKEEPTLTVRCLSSSFGISFVILAHNFDA